MINELTTDLHKRQKKLSRKKNPHSYFLKDVDSEDLIRLALYPIIEGANQFKNFANICITIGNMAMRVAGLKPDTKKALFCGWFILCSYINLGLVKYQLSNSRNRKKKRSREGYRLKIVNEQKILDTIGELEEESSEEKLLAMAPNKKAENWEDPISKTGLSIIKRSEIDEFEKRNNKILYRVLNKLNNTGWRVNRDVFKVYEYFLNNDTVKSPFKHKTMKPLTQKDHQAQQSHKISAMMIYRMAELHLGKPFYHLYSLDFRGRIYPNSSYLTEQSSDLSRGLLLLNEGKPVDETAWKYFCIHGSNVLGSSETTTEKRLQEISELEGKILKTADNPIESQWWIDAEKPFMFLAWCMEYAALRRNPTKVSHLPVFCDASCNGTQHLAALSLDDKIGYQVNLLKSEEPQDIYSYIGDKLWYELEKLYNKIPQDEIDQFEPLWAESIERHAHYHNLVNNEDEGAADYYKELAAWRQKTSELRNKLFPVYWMGIEDRAIRRKIVKRPTMTMPYMSSAFGKGTQVYADSRGINQYLEDVDPVWCYKLGRLAHTVCNKYLEGPGRLLNMFKSVSELYNSQKKHLHWSLPITNFKVQQMYVKQSTRQACLREGRRRVQIVYKVNNGRINTRGQRNGTAANVVHSLDAAHMAMVIDSAGFPVVGVHDSFGALPADMHELHKIIRQEFIRLYKEDPLDKILKTMRIGDFKIRPPQGTLDLNMIKDAEYAFY